MEPYKKIQTENLAEAGYPSHLKLLFGGLHKSAKKQKRIEDFWIFCHSIFWSTEVFTPEQETEFKILIGDHFAKSTNINKTFKQLIERATLAKRYIRRRSGRYVAKPIDWLNINYRCGLSGTMNWYNQVADQRTTVPHYNEGIALLAEAILSYSKRRNILEVADTREKFIALKQNDLLFLYTNTIMHMHFINF